MTDERQRQIELYAVHVSDQLGEVVNRMTPEVMRTVAQLAADMKAVADSCRPLSEFAEMWQQLSPEHQAEAQRELEDLRDDIRRMLGGECE